MTPLSTTRTHVLRALAVAATTAALALLAPALAPGAHAADLSRFDPGLIITDQAFTDSRTMTAEQVQSFLDSRNPSCVPAPDGTPCLRTATFDTPSRTADDRCRGAYQGATRESAASVITKVARACQINPQVLLVMLQKEQGLVTASGRSLTPSRYRSAMGFGCPDTAACDAKYYGFFNQVYQAAWQLNSYALNPLRYSHRAGVVNNVRFHPNAACGSSPVLIRNQATASLYNYTPYQPNRAALAAGYGTGDSCSSYGNRNFYSYFTDWFGRPDAGDPIGVVEAVTATNTTVTVSGWALDPSTSSSNTVHVYLGAQGVAVTADRPRADIAAAYGMGDKHGFSVTLPATPGAHTACAYSMGVTGRVNTLLGCYPVVVRDSAPIGSVDAITVSGSKVTVSGWTWDPDTSAPTDVHVYVDGVGVALRADRQRPDVAAAFGTAPTRGFSHSREVTPGTHTVCVYAMNTAAGPHTSLGCHEVRVATAAPIGSIDAVTVDAGTLTVSGWTWDPDTSAPTDVHVYVDGVGVALRADRQRPDVAAVYGTAPTRGYSHSRAVGAGSHTVCVYAIDTGPAAPTALGCRDVRVATAAPIGSIDAVNLDGGQLTVSGWTWDPDTSAPTDVHVYVDGVGVALRADRQRPDVAAVYGTAPTRGYVHSQAVGGGSHSVCVYAIDTNGGPPVALGCRTVTARSTAPMGAVDQVAASGGQVTISGWTWDPDTSAPTDVHVYVDGVGVALRADGHRPDVAAVFGTAPARGYTHTRAVAPGAHEACVYAMNTGPGGHTLLGCYPFTSS